MIAASSVSIPRSVSANHDTVTGAFKLCNGLYFSVNIKLLNVPLDGGLERGMGCASAFDCMAFLALWHPGNYASSSDERHSATTTCF